MATSISSLTYKIIADTTDFTKGIGATKREIGAAKKVIEQTAAPIDKMNQSIAGMDRLLGQGLLTTKQHAAGVKKIKEETLGANKATSDFGEMIKGYLGAQGVMMLFSKATQTVGDAFRYVNEETNKAIESTKAMQPATQRLRQVARAGDGLTKAQDLDKMLRTRDQMAMQFGISRDDASNIMFSARSEGFEGAMPAVAKFARTFGSAETAITAAGQFPGLFPGADITPRQSLNMSLVASGRSRATFEKLVQAMPIAASGLSQAGSTPAETLALGSVLASSFATPKMAGERLKTFGSKVSQDEKLSGLGGAVAAAEALQGMPKKERDEFLKESIELRDAYKRITQNLPEIKRRRALVTREQSLTGTPEAAMSQLYMAASDPTTKAGREFLSINDLNRAAVRREIANEDQFFLGGAARKTALDNAMASFKESDASGFVQYVAETAGWAAQGVQVPAQQVKQATVVSGSIADQNMFYLKQMTEYLESIAGKEEPPVIEQDIQ